MNLQAKQVFSQHAFDIYKNGEDLEVIANQIEALMATYNISFTTANQYTTTSENKKIKNAHLRFIDALDAEEIIHAQHMKVILAEHCNFLNATWIIINQAA